MVWKRSCCCSPRVMYIWLMRNLGTSTVYWIKNQWWAAATVQPENVLQDPVSSESTWPRQKIQVMLLEMNFQNKSSLSWVNSWNSWFSSLPRIYRWIEMILWENGPPVPPTLSSMQPLIRRRQCQSLMGVSSSLPTLCSWWFYLSSLRKWRYLPPEKRNSKIF